MTGVTLPVVDYDVDGRLRLFVSPRYREKVKSIPGATYDHKTETWRLWPGWLTATALRREFPDLQLTERANAWGGEKRAEWAHRLAAKESAVQADSLYPFQQNGVAYLSMGARALLADEMGLGKTVQAITALRSVKSYGLPAVVVATNSMLHKWKEEFNKWAPELTVNVVSGTAAQRKKLLAPGADVYILGWSTVRYHSRLAPFGSITLSEVERTPKELDVLSPKTVIVDEAHRMVDPKAKQTRAVWNLQSYARYRWSLTGTPITNSPENIWSILHGLAPEEFPSRSGFLDRYCLAGSNYFGGLEVFGLRPEHREELFSVVDSFMLRRTKAEVLPQLPPKVYTTRYAELGKPQRQAYNNMREHLLADVEGGIILADNPLTQLTRLLQIAAATPVVDESGNVVALARPSAKLDTLYEIIDEAPNEPLVIFTQSRKFADLVLDDLRSHNLRVGSVTGTVTGEARAAVVREFQEGEVDYIVCTLGAGGEGITLTRASTVVFLQRSFSMVQDRQAEDRLHRIGQEAESVQVIDVVCEDTAEYRLFDAIYRKGEHFESIVRDGARLRALLK